MEEYLIRFFAGGLMVSAFAAVGDVLRPKSFAGLFGAAPSQQSRYIETDKFDKAKGSAHNVAGDIKDAVKQSREYKSQQKLAAQFNWAASPCPELVSAPPSVLFSFLEA